MDVYNLHVKTLVAKEKACVHMGKKTKDKSHVPFFGTAHIQFQFFTIKVIMV